MTIAQTLTALKKAGTVQNMKVYGNHGVKGEMYGVSFAALKSLNKTIGFDRRLSTKLWTTGNHDARILACMVADPAAMSARDLDAWCRVEVDHGATSCKTPDAATYIDKVLAHRAKKASK